MSHRRYRLLGAVALLALAAGLCPARADEVEAVKEKLFQAKKDYDADVQKFKKAVGDVLDKKEEDARKTGDKKAVDAAKALRRAFEDTGDLPPLPAAVKQPISAARAKLDKAFAAAVKDYVKLKEDAAAELAEKEQRQFAFDAAVLFGKRTNVSGLKAADVTVWNNWFEKDTAKYKMGKDAVPHSVFMHPNFRGEASASYALPPKVLAFRAGLGVPTHEDKQGDPASPLTFEVLGDGKSLWKSEPVTKLDAFQTCTVKVEKVKVLTLKVHCPNEHGGAHAVWFAPVLVE